MVGQRRIRNFQLLLGWSPTTSPSGWAEREKLHDPQARLRAHGRQHVGKLRHLLPAFLVLRMAHISIIAEIWLFCQPFSRSFISPCHRLYHFLSAAVLFFFGQKVVPTLDRGSCQTIASLTRRSSSVLAPGPRRWRCGHHCSRHHHQGRRSHKDRLSSKPPTATEHTLHFVAKTTVRGAEGLCYRRERLFPRTQGRL